MNVARDWGYPCRQEAYFSNKLFYLDGWQYRRVTERHEARSLLQDASWICFTYHPFSSEFLWGTSLAMRVGTSRATPGSSLFQGYTQQHTGDCPLLIKALSQALG